MKRIVGISIGSSKRDHYVETELLGEKFIIERIGTDGSIEKAIQLIEKLDGEVDAFGMGGIDLYLWAGKRRYIIREALSLRRAAKKTPIVDGSGLKHTLERKVIYYLKEQNIIDFDGKKVLIPSVLDRFGMSEAIEGCGGKLIIGDLIFALGVNIPVHSMKIIHNIAKVLAPIVCQLPFHMLYPVGDHQNENTYNKASQYYEQSDIIAGDYHYIKKYMPPSMNGKVVITNTVTKEDLIEMDQRGVDLLVTTTPELGGRSFGTNVLEAVIVSILKEREKDILYTEYESILTEMNLTPRIENLKADREIRRKLS